MRGLVTLRELAGFWVAAGAVQLGLCLWLDARLLPLLVVAWVYLGLMTKEFFAREWLKARPVAYLLSHMLIMPIVDLYATACDWLVAGHGRPPAGVLIFLIVSFFSGIVLEFGRKIRAPEDEEHGVETYSFLWGPRVAATVWLSALLLGATFAITAAYRVGVEAVTAAVLGLFFLLCLYTASRYLGKLQKGFGRRIENLSGVWVLVIYVLLGIAPLMARA
jgi:4-hydroxybenzoate polyprenyltransferase